MLITPPIVGGRVIGYADTQQFCKNANVIVTDDGGIATALINDTGHTSVRGEVVCASTSIDRAVSLVDNDYDPVGIIYNAGVPIGGIVWIVTSLLAYVLYETGAATSRRGWVRVSATQPGKCSSEAKPTALSANHFYEVGHCLETKQAQQGVAHLALTMVHFL